MANTPEAVPELRAPTPAGGPTPAQLAAAAATFTLLGSPARLHLVWLMAHGAANVGTLAAQIGLSIATASQHLSKLRLAGVITSRKQGRHVYYSVEDPHVLTVVEQIFSHIAPDGTLAPDPQ